MIQKKHKDKLIGGLIGLFIMTIGLIIKEYFYNSSKNNEEKKTNNSVIINANDSLKVTNLQSSQSNYNKGNVNNEYILGDKKIYSTPENNFKKNTKIENSGNLNIGQSGGTVNQTIINPKPAPRKLNESDINKLLTIKSDYVISFPMIDNESKEFANQIIQYLNSKNLRYQIENYGHIVPDYNERFLITDNKITIYRLK
jgi:hypothetical protein